MVSCAVSRAWKVEAMKTLKSTGNSRPSTELKPFIRFDFLNDFHNWPKKIQFGFVKCLKTECEACENDFI